MTADNAFQLFLNGALIGASPNTTHAWKSANAFIVALSPTMNLFAVRASNLPSVTNGGESPAGLLASIQISFSDGTSDIVISDSTWKSTKSIPIQFQSLATDDSKWDFANVQAPFGSGPWETTVQLPSVTPALSLKDSIWVWSSEDDNPPNAPPGSRAFRNTYAVPNGKNPVAITVIVSADNAFILYLNGEIVGTSPFGSDTWKVAQRYTPSLFQNANQVEQFVFAINATNTPTSIGFDNPAGLIVAVQITYSDGTFDTYRSDSTWLVDKIVTPDFFQVSTSDSTWSNVTTLGAYGIIPWGNITVTTPTSGSESQSAILITPTPIPSNASNYPKHSNSALIPRISRIRKINLALLSVVVVTSTIVF